MRKITFFIAFALFMSVTAFAQRDGVAPLAKGDMQLNFGTGFSDNYLPVYFSWDFALHKDVTLTPEVHANFPFSNDKSFGGGVLVKADYHWNYLIGIPSNWDFYAGARAGFSFGDDFLPEFGIQVGGRWYWSDSWGLNAELAAGTGFGFTFGLSKKL
jgi:hypothetical protein